MEFGITARDDKKRAVKLAKVLEEYLEAREHIVSLDKRVFSEGKKFQEICPDFMIIIGGDGTILNTVHRLNCDPKILTINMGTYGFLAHLNPQNVISSVKNILNDEYLIEEHSRIEVSIEGDNEFNGPQTALNDVTLLTPDWTIRKFAYYIDDQRVDSIRGDGIVISTPTGSTGYSMSAGGPYIDPRVEGLVVNSLLPMNRNSAPVVLPDDVKISIEVLGDEYCTFSIDGITNKNIQPDERVNIVKSDKPIQFVRVKERYPHMIRRIKDRN